MKHSQKLAHLPPYIFAQIDDLVHEKISQGQKLWVLSKSDPDQPTSSDIVEALNGQSIKPVNHHYPDFDGLLSFRKEIAHWYRQQHGVSLDPESEILPLQGSKEGLVHFCQAWVDPGDVILLPDPAFPTYKTATALSGGKAHFMPLRPPTFRPRLEDIPSDIAKAAKIMFLNYPNNPTGAIIDRAFWEEILDFTRQNDIILANDHAYAMTYFKPNTAPSLLSVSGTKEQCIEFFTFSKAFHMAGWRLGFAVGNSDVLHGLKIIETHVNAGIFNPLQYAGAEALHQGLAPDYFKSDNESYLNRLKKLAQFFAKHGWHVQAPDATVYLWVPAPANMSGEEFSQFLLEKANVVVSPGKAFGDEGEHYVRFCVTYPDEVVDGAIESMEKAFIQFNIRPPLKPIAAR